MATPPGNRSNRQWLALADVPLFPGSPYTLHQYCFMLLQMKSCEHQHSNEAFNAHVKLSGKVMPAGNLARGLTLRIIRVVLSVRPHTDFLRHVCLGPDGDQAQHTATASCGLYPAVDKAHWDADECCPCCGTSRFVKTTDVHGRCEVQPRYPPMYYFGVEECVRNLFADAEWCSERRCDRKGKTVAHTCWGGKYFERVNEETDGALFHPDNDAYELAFDWVQPFKWNNRVEVGVFLLRAVGLGTESRGKGKFIKVLGLIVTTKKPKHLGPYLSEMHEEFDVLEGDGLSVYDTALKAQITHRGFLLLAAGDTPVITSYVNAWGHTAIWGCWRCFFQGMSGKKLGGGGGVFFQGYSKPAVQSHGVHDYSVSDNGDFVMRQKVPHGDKNAVLKADEAQSTTHELLMAAAQHAEALISAGAKSIPTPCVHGRSMFWRRPYFDLRWGVQIPVCHCFLYGIVKKICKLYLPKKAHHAGAKAKCAIGTAIQEIMSERANSVKVPADCTRAYRDIVKNGGSWTMEDYGLFVGSVGTYIFRGAWGSDDSPYWRIWCLLNKVYHILFEGTHERPPGALVEAVAALEELAALCEEHLPHDACTPNLHTFVRHVREAEEQTGSIGAALEVYVERGIRDVVAPSRNRSTKELGAFLVNEMNDKIRVAELASTMVLPGQQIDEEQRPIYQVSAAFRRSINDWVDPPRADGGNYFSTVGKQVSFDGSEGAKKRKLLCDFFVARGAAYTFNLSALTPNVDFTVHVFGTAALQGQEVHSRSYTRTQARCSNHVAVDCEDDNGTPFLQFGEVLWYWLLRVNTPAGAAPVETVRLARLDIYKTTKAPEAAAARLWGEVDTTVIVKDVLNKMVEVSAIRGKVIKAQTSKTRAMMLPFFRN